MDAVAHEYLGQVGDRGAFADPQPEIDVLGALERGAIAADRRQKHAPGHDGRMGHDAVADGEPFGDGGVIQRMARPPAQIAAVGVDEGHLSADHAELRHGRQGRHLQFEPARHRDVVGVHAGDQRRARFGQSAVEGADESEPAVAQHADAAVGRREPVEDLRRRVGRRIVDRQQLEIRVRLREHAAHSGFHEALRVPDGHDHADVGSAGGNAQANPTAIDWDFWSRL